MIPAMVDIARDVITLAPDALFFNYGNPMSPVCRGVRKATGANMVGLCHGVYHVGHYLAHALGVEESRLDYTAAGINHLTWFVDIRVDGEDAMPRLHQIADERLARLGEAPPEELDVFCWQLLKLFGAFPAVLDRHVSEFFPQFFRDGGYYGRTLGVDVFSFEGTIASGDAIFEEMRQAAFSPDPLGQDYFDRLSGEHEQVIEIIDGIRRGSGRVYSANLPNRGQVPNLPMDAVIESPCAATSSGLVPIDLPPIPQGAAGTLASRFAWVETVVDAALEGSRDKFVQALVLDGSVDSMETAQELADDLIEAQEEYLPQFGSSARRR